MAQVAVTSEPLDLLALTRDLVRLTTGADAAGSADDGSARTGLGAGAIATFTGLVRDHNQGRRVRFLEYEAYEPLALRALALIVDETYAAWPSVRLAIHHRIGRLEIGEASVIIAAMSPHRADAFAACRYAIERVKQIAPIWKREHFEGGDVWLEGAIADPDDETAKRTAYRIACA